MDSTVCSEGKWKGDTRRCAVHVTYQLSGYWQRRKSLSRINSTSICYNIVF